MKNKIKKLLFDLSVVESMLNSNTFDSKSVEQHSKLLQYKKLIQSEIALYSIEEIEETTKPREKTKSKVEIIEYEKKITYERSLLWWFLMIYLLSNKVENKAFLMIAVDIFCKDEKIEYKEVMKI